MEIGYGDWSIMKHVFLDDKYYVGYEVVESLRRPSTNSQEFHIVKDLSEVTEKGDLLLVRDVMMHWPNSQIDYFIKNILPNFKYALLTNDDTTEKPNPDIKLGQWRKLNLYMIDHL